MRRRQHEAARSDKVERLGITPWLNNHRPQGRTAGRFLASTQDGRGVTRLHKNQPLRRQAKLSQTRRIDLAQLKTDKVLPDPYKWSSRRGAQRQSDDKSCGRRLIQHARRKNLMQGAPRKAAPQAGVKRLCAR